MVKIGDLVTVSIRYVAECNRSTRRVDLVALEEDLLCLYLGESSLQSGYIVRDSDGSYLQVTSVTKCSVVQPLSATSKRWRKPIRVPVILGDN